MDSRFVAGLLALTLSACADTDPTHACTARGATAPCTRVLFVGNSYTFTNDLPAIFVGLARAGGHDAITAIAAGGGATLGAHATAPATAKLIDSLRWNIVVLQEQSQIPAVEVSRQVTMYPAVRTLTEHARRIAATVLLFQTWARRDGWPENGLTDYAHMQAAIDSGYRLIGAELGIDIVPAGDVWANVSNDHPDIPLWQSDGSHPTVAGTYLAACAFYAAVFHHTPVGLGFVGTLPPRVARTLQEAVESEIARQTTFLK